MGYTTIEIDLPDKYYALFSCDEWRTHSSAKLIGVFSRGGLQIN